MPLLMPLTEDEEQPKTYRFALISSVNVGSKMTSTPLGGSVNVGRGSGAVATFVVVSEIIEGAR